MTTTTTHTDWTGAEATMDSDSGQFTDPRIAMILTHGTGQHVMAYVTECLRDGALGDLADMLDALRTFGADPWMIRHVSDSLMGVLG